MFSKNFDLIMNITGVQSSALGRACHLDPSHISRLRSGARPLPKKPEFLDDMCLYLARHVREKYQKNALCDVMRLSSWPTDDEIAAKHIKKWFLGEETSPPDPTPLLVSFSGSGSLRVPAPEDSEKAGILPGIKSYYYGAEGKREAVLQFFDLILKQKTPGTLLLFSEEEMNWLYEEPAFAQMWARDFTKVLRSGNRVKIIHHVGRGMNEMLEAVAKWIPMYLTGMIEPFYYPRLRDDMFQHTLFIAPETAAVVSTSVGRRSDGMLNELITDSEAVAALNREFDRYLALCRPLMSIMSGGSRTELWKTFNALARTDGSMICMSDMPTLVTMPEWVAEAMQKRAPESCISEQRHIAAELLSGLSDGADYTEILPPPEKMTELPPPCFDLLGAPELCYTAEEWRAHIESSANFAGGHNGYRQYIRSDIPANISLFAREDRGVILMKSIASDTAFAFSEVNMVNAFWDFLNRKKNKNLF